MLEKRMKENLQKIEQGILPVTPETAFAALQELTTDSCEINFDKKTGEIKTIKVKSYDTTIEGAVDAALEGLDRARFPPATTKLIRIFQDEDGEFIPQVDVRMTRSERAEASDALYKMLERLRKKEEESPFQKVEEVKDRLIEIEIDDDGQIGAISYPTSATVDEIAEAAKRLQEVYVSEKMEAEEARQHEKKDEEAIE